jgi:spore maturation protein CgeB
MDDDMEDTSVKIQYMITEEMKRVLMGELGYSKVEVNDGSNFVVDVML